MAKDATLKPDGRIPRRPLPYFDEQPDDVGMFGELYHAFYGHIKARVHWDVVNDNGNRAGFGNLVIVMLYRGTCHLSLVVMGRVY